MSSTPIVSVEDHGRSGVVRYREDDREILFDWEFCTGDCIAEVWPRELQGVRTDPSWPAHRLTAVLRFVATELLAQKAPDCTYTIDEESCRIALLKNKSADGAGTR